MTIPLPPLDDRTYADLVAEARTMIPGLHPAWTDHNPSDPGIVLVELLAWLTEMLVYQLGELDDRHTAVFLALLNGPEWTAPDGDLGPAVRETVAGLRERWRAATPDDVEHLVRDVWPAQGGRPVRRVRCVPRRILGAPVPAAGADEPDPQAAHLGVVVLPEPAAGETHPAPTEAEAAAIHAFLEPRRILTTRHHVVGPGYVDLTVEADVVLAEDAPTEAGLTAAKDALLALLSPLTGGPDGGGWPFGRGVRVSELYAALEGVPLVDYAEAVRVSRTGLDVHELPRLREVRFTVYDTAGKGTPWTWRAP